MPDEIRRLSDDLARDPSSLVFMRLADALRRAGQLDIALRVALRGLDRHPYVADAHDVLARIHADRGDLERAADEWEMALRLDPAHAQARLGLGFIDFRRGDLESAERRLSAAAEPDASVASALAHVRSALAARGGSAAVADGAPVIVGPAPAESPAPTVRPVPAPPNRSTVMSAALASPGHPTPASPIPEIPAPDTSRARQLFAPVLDGSDQTALLVDADGLVLAGSYTDASGGDVADIVAAELAAWGAGARCATSGLGSGRHCSSKPTTPSSP
jgi:tetratricopeptide (TPR) repeat protein